MREREKIGLSRKPEREISQHHGLDVLISVFITYYTFATNIVKRTFIIFSFLSQV